MGIWNKPALEQVHRVQVHRMQVQAQAMHQQEQKEVGLRFR